MNLQSESYRVPTMWVTFLYKIGLNEARAGGTSYIRGQVLVKICSTHTKIHNDTSCLHNYRHKCQVQVDTAHCTYRRMTAQENCTNFNVDKCVSHVACLDFSLWETGYEKFNVECFLGSWSKKSLSFMESEVLLQHYVKNRSFTTHIRNNSSSAIGCFMVEIHFHTTQFPDPLFRRKIMFCFINVLPNKVAGIILIISWRSCDGTSC